MYKQMNVRTNSAGYVSEKHILESGFIINKTTTYPDIDSSYTLTDYSKDDNLFLTGGYWTYYLKDKQGNLLWEGWWNTNGEFDETIKELESRYEQTK